MTTIISNNQELTKKQRRELRRQEKLEKQRQEDKRQQIKKIVLGASVVLIIGSVLFLLTTIELGGSSSSTALPVNRVAATDWTKGSQSSNIVLIEYSDFQCPACQSYQPVVKQLMDELGEQIVFVYRHFPLSQIHKNAEPAARAAEAAGRQNKFWQMHDLLFQRQQEWSEGGKAQEFFLQYADSLNLDVAQFENDMKAKEVKQKVKNDYQSGVRNRVQGTPSFFLNGQKLQNPRNYEEFKKLIQEVL